MNDKSKKWLKLRILLVLMGFVLVTITISAKAYQLHVLRNEELSELANRQQKRGIPVAPNRGAIYDRNREDLAVSIDVDSIYAEPRKITNASEYAGKLSPILGMSEKALKRKFALNRHFTWIKRRITPDQSMRVQDLKLASVGFVRESKRFHPNRETAASIVGFVGLDPKGLEGLELQYDDYLKGEAAFSVVERDALGRLICSNGLGRRDGLTGNDLILTIDKTIQYLAEEELKKGMIKAKAKRGIVIVMDPRNGQLLAVAIYPQFNPNCFWEYPASAWRNRAITDSFEPGSTFKVFLLAASLEEGIVSRNNIFFCENGRYRVGKETVHDIHPHAWLSVKNIVKVSSNIGAGKIGEELGKKKLYLYIRKFGFGKKTGIDLPGETQGLVRPCDKWSRIAVDTISFGQGISVSAIQLITGLSVIANKGRLMKPYVVKRIVNPGGTVIKEFKPQVVGRVISEETAKEVTYILKSTVLKGGTGTTASLDGYEVAGKTGTAQKADLSSGGYLKNKYVASFMGFVPADDPVVAILVVIDEPSGNYYGGQTAAPVFKTIAERTLHYLDVLPTKAVARRSATPSKKGYGSRKSQNLKVKGSSGTTRSKRFVMPDFSGMSIRQVLRLMHDSKIDIRIIGSGKAMEQSFRPGSPVKAGAKCWIKFQQPS